jgi:hypothetical protein
LCFIDDVAFAEFDRHSNFVPNYILPDIVAHSKNQENCNPCRMYFLRDGIVDSLIEQKKIFYVKYYLFHDVIVIVKSIIFKLKTININIYIYIYLYFKLFNNLNFKSILNQTH